MTKSENKETRRNYKYLLLLATLNVTIFVATVPLAYKILQIKFIEVPAIILVFPLVFVTGDIIAEVYGFRIARQVLWCSIICDLLFATIETTLSQIPTPQSAAINYGYTFVLGSSLQAALGGVAGIILGSFTNIYTLTKLKIRLHGNFFFFRSVMCSTTGELITIIIGATIAYVGKLPAHQIIKMISCMYLIDVVYICFTAWIATEIVYSLKRTEKIDVFDTNIKFNPFKFKIDET